MLAKRIVLLTMLAVFFTTFALAPFAIARQGRASDDIVVDTAPDTPDEGENEAENENNGAEDELKGPILVTLPERLPLPDRTPVGDIVIDIEKPQLGLPPNKAPELPYADEAGVFVPYAVPLSVEEQKLVERIAARYNVHEELVYGVMWAESRYDRNAVGRNNRYLGVMQISKSNLPVLKKYCGVTNLMNFEQNVTAGCYYLGHYLSLYDHNMNIALLYYHGGYRYANPMIAQGILEDRYTREVFAEMNRILEIRKKTAEEMGVRIKGWLYEY